MRELTSVKDFMAAIGEKRVLVDFWAPWCGPCKALGPVLEAMEKDHPDILFCKLNADTDHGQDIGAKYGLGSLPTMMYFEQGAKKRQLVGNTAKAKIEAFLSV